MSAFYPVNSHDFGCGREPETCELQNYIDKLLKDEVDEPEQVEILSSAGSWVDSVKNLENKQRFFIPRFGSSSADTSSFVETETNEVQEPKVKIDGLDFRRSGKREGLHEFTGGTFVDDNVAPPTDDKFKWGSAIKQSFMVLGIQHGYALLIQPRTRRALNGNFFRDYIDSVKAISGWDDGNKFFTNYIAHPMQGGLTGFIFVQNSPKASRQQFGKSKEYWNSRLKAFLWSAAWSTQFELGPISQSSIGNVGLAGHMGFVDIVMTPTVGTGWLISEEAIDRYAIRHWETKGFAVKVMSRMFLNPMRTIANLLRFKQPWYRDREFGD